MKATVSIDAQPSTQLPDSSAEQAVHVRIGRKLRPAAVADSRQLDLFSFDDSPMAVVAVFEASQLLGQVRAEVSSPVDSGAAAAAAQPAEATVLSPPAAIEPEHAAVEPDHAAVPSVAAEEVAPEDADDQRRAPARRASKERPAAAKSSAEDTSRASSTTRMLVSLRRARHDPLTPEREAELGRRSLAGDMAARNELVERNMRYMAGMARGFLKTGRPLDDLFQAGAEGLMTAAEKFDPAKGRFTTIATWWIRQRIQRSVHADSNMPVPAYLPYEEAKLLRQAEAATSDEEREKLRARAEVAAKRLEARRKQSVSLDQPTGGAEEDEGSNLMSMMEAEEAGQDERLERMRLVSKLVELANDLGESQPRERTIFLMRLGMHPDYLGEGLALGEIADAVNLSRERVRQLYLDAATKIADAVEDWAQGAENLPAGFRKGLMSPSR